jgi:hypothetical protein
VTVPSAKASGAFLAALLVGPGNWAFDHFMYDWLVGYIENHFGIDHAKIIASISSWTVC